MPEQKKIGNFLEGAVLRQICNAIAPIQKTGLPLVHEAQRRFSGNDALEARTVGRVTAVTCR
jgi:hypothetical protein